MSRHDQSIDPTLLMEYAAQPHPPYRIVIIGDNPDDRQLARRQLELEYPTSPIVEISNPEQLAAVLHRMDFDVVITDYQLKWTTGLEVLRMIKQRDRFRPVIMFTATATQEEALQAMREGLDDYVIKTPMHFVRLRGVLEHVIQTAAAKRRLYLLESRLSALLERLRIGVFRSTLFGQLLDANTPLLRILGVSSIKQASQSEQFRRMLWPEGRPGPLDLTHADGDEIVRDVVVSNARGERHRFLARLSYRRIDGEMYVEGLLEPVHS